MIFKNSAEATSFFSKLFKSMVDQYSHALLIFSGFSIFHNITYIQINILLNASQI